MPLSRHRLLSGTSRSVLLTQAWNTKNWVGGGLRAASSYFGVALLRGSASNGLVDFWCGEMPPAFWIATGTVVFGEDGEMLSGVAHMDAEVHSDFGGRERPLASEDVGSVVPGGGTPAREPAGMSIPGDDVLAAYTPSREGPHTGQLPVGQGVFQAALVTGYEGRSLGCREEVISEITE
jgi:hypothetical protein